jgi:riboflavin biosynthesis pyrimidine reductase
VAGEDDVDLAAALDSLAARGLRRVLCEGGPSLLADVAAAGRLDELCVTFSPQLVGGDGPRILHGTELDVVLQPALLLEQDGMLLARYVRAERRA